MIETPLLRYALAAADTGSLSQAAARFGLKQSTLSKHIHHLEDQLGLRLFNRSARGVEPTRVGKGFLRKARQIVADTDRLGAECAALSAEPSRAFRFGFQGSLGCGALASVFRAFRSAFPDIAVTALERGRLRLLRALEREELDLAIIGGVCDTSGLSSAPLWFDPVLLCVEQGHRLTECDRLYWTDLGKNRFITTAEDPGSDLRDLVLSRLSAPGHVPAVAVQKVHRDNLPALVSNGIVGLLAGQAPSNATRRHAFRSVHDAFGPTVLEYRAYWRPDNVGAPLAGFLELLAERCGTSAIR
ncbi:LysR family transcriptional regulator [Sphingomonas sp. CJ20]